MNSLSSGLLRALAAQSMCLVVVGSLWAQGSKTAAPVPVATFQGAAITEEDLQKSAAGDLEKLEIQRLQQNAEYLRNKRQILETNLSRLLEDRLLEAESNKRGVTKEALLSKELEGKVKEPTDQDINAFYETNKQRIGRPIEQVRIQIQQYLRTENYAKAKGELVGRLKADYGVAVNLEPFRMHVETVGRPSVGPEGAPITVVEFSDFQCPFCSRLSTTLHEMTAKYGTEVRLVYRQFPLSQIHPFAEKAAEASLCAAEQGHFWEMHDLMFQTQDQLKEDDLKAKAAKLQLDVAAFGQCLNANRHSAEVKQDQYDGSVLGVTGTPALFINGRFLSGAVSLQDISRIIDEELRLQRPTNVASGEK